MALNNPKISIITPSYNQGQYIEETILSVLNQNYPNIEYIIIDGGSTDNTVDIIKKYKDKIAYWVSEPDAGQPNAINKGLQKASGDILAFINSDDYYEPGSFEFIAEKYLQGQEWVICGVRNFRFETGESYFVTQKANGNLLDWLVRKNQNHQPGNFWSRKIFEKAGYMDESLHYSFDWDYWLKFITAGFVPVTHDEKIVASFRLHNESKTVKFWSKFNQEYIFLINKYKIQLASAEVKLADNEIKKLQLTEKITLARIESINGHFTKSFNYFKEAFKISPVIIFTPKFLMEFLKGMIYMPVRKKIK